LARRRSAGERQRREEKFPAIDQAPIIDDLGTNLRPPSSAATRAADRVFELKSEIHRKLIGVLNLERVSSIPKIACAPKSGAWSKGCSTTSGRR